MQLFEILKLYSYNFLISLSISDFEIGAECHTLGAGCPTLPVATQSRKGERLLIPIYPQYYLVRFRRTPTLTLREIWKKHTEVEKMACMWFGEICYCCS